MLTRACDLMCRGAAMGRSERGLFHGKTKQYGNKISFSHRVSRRSWTPNIQSKKLTSQLLDVTLKVPVTTKTIRCIDKAGSLDTYVLLTHPNKLASRSGEELRGLLIPKWEARHKRPYDRRQLVYESRLVQRQKKGRISVEEAVALINKSRVSVAVRRKWAGKIPLLKDLSQKSIDSAEILEVDDTEALVQELADILPTPATTQASTPVTNDTPSSPTPTL